MFWASLGVSITSDVFGVGRPATVTCVSDTEVSTIEWLHNGVTLESSSATSTKQLALIFSQINDSIHGEVYTCRVTRVNGMKAQQVFIPDVIGEENLSSMTLYLTM